MIPPQLLSPPPLFLSVLEGSEIPPTIPLYVVVVGGSNDGALIVSVLFSKYIGNFPGAHGKNAFNFPAFSFNVLAGER